MSLPTRDNPYNFDAFLKWRKEFDYYADDPFIQKVLTRYAGKDAEQADRAARKLSQKASYRWRDIADAISYPEQRPYMMHYDGHNHRIDRIVRPGDTLAMEKEIFSEGIFSSRTSPWEKLIKMYLVYQNSEACVACPMTCTEGLVDILDKFADTPETKAILQHCREGIDGEFAIGAQYLSEIQGGSDVPANVLEAVEEGGLWRLYGTKFFCSATHADYAVVTAKPVGSEKVALFVVPSWLPGDKEKEVRNGYTIDRIKWKMGTSELTTAEITFKGAVAYPVGPLDRGVANVVGIVLTRSRLTVGLSCAASMTRAAREAKNYSEFREAFGVIIGTLPMVAGQVRSLERQAKRATAAAFKVYSEFLKLEGGLKGGLVTDEPIEMRRKRFAVRELIMLQKIVASWDCTEVVRAAMSIFGGHGVMEDFSSLPRLYRDAAVNELWEGPRNVLLTQIHNDIQRASSWYKPSEFAADVLAGVDPARRAKLAAEMEELTSIPNLFGNDEKTIEICARWDDFCQRLFNAYQDGALAEVEA
ncbi:MAG: acyl-CoA dehydrogenase family protein [Smithellaceae bacterium]|nr:acyl-CoA dehydrogenase family protein [Smithellaceae bacterium]